MVSRPQGMGGNFVSCSPGVGGFVGENFRINGGGLTILPGLTWWQASCRERLPPPVRDSHSLRISPRMLMCINKNTAFIVGAGNLAGICFLIHKLYDPETFIRCPRFGPGGTRRGRPSSGRLALPVSRVAGGNFARRGRPFFPGPMAYPNQCCRAWLVCDIL